MTDWTEAVFLIVVICCLAGAALWMLYVLLWAWLELTTLTR